MCPASGSIPSSPCSGTHSADRKEEVERRFYVKGNRGHDLEACSASASALVKAMLGGHGVLACIGRHGKEGHSENPHGMFSSTVGVARGGFKEAVAARKRFRPSQNAKVCGECTSNNSKKGVRLW